MLGAPSCPQSPQGLAPSPVLSPWGGEQGTSCAGTSCGTATSASLLATWMLGLEGGWGSAGALLCTLPLGFPTAELL